MIRDIILIHLQVKTLAPILICSMKIFIHIISQGGKGADEAAENRNYLSGRMSDELNEIIRVLQLTTYDEEEWDADQLTVNYFAFCSHDLNNKGVTFLYITQTCI